MAIIIETNDPSSLLKAIRDAINDGDVATWDCDDDGDFSHVPNQWHRKAWLRPKIIEKRIILTIMPPRDTRLSTLVYAVYHGRFVEMLLNHFDSKFDDARCTPYPAHGDLVEA